MKLELKVNDFFDVDSVGKSHTKKDRGALRKKLTELLKKENIASVFPGRAFQGPQVSSDVWSMFDEAKFRVWHVNKEKELLKIEKFKEHYFS